MCEAKPGHRCAGDTQGVAVSTLERYSTAHPDGPSVDPLTAAASQHTPPTAQDYIAEADRKVSAAQADVGAARARWEEARRVADEASSKANAVFREAQALRDEAATHEAEARTHGNAALVRTRDLYSQHGVNPRLMGYYVSDMREAAGLHRDFEPEVQTGLFLNGRELNVKVKRNGPDAEPTRAAREAAKTDADFQAAVTAFNDSKAKAVEKYAQAEAVLKAGDPQMSAGQAAEREARLRETELMQATDALGRARTDAGRARARAQAGAPMEGRQEKLGYRLKGSIYVDSDGATNLWLHHPDPDGSAGSYEPVRVVQASGNRFAHLESASGKRVAAVRRYANFASFRSAPEVWVGSPTVGARPVREVHEHVVLEETIDSGD